MVDAVPAASHGVAHGRKDANEIGGILRQSKRARGRKSSIPDRPARSTRYRRLRHVAQPEAYFSTDQIAAIHDAALTLLEERGMKVLHAGARHYYKSAGATVKGEMVFVGREIVARALQVAPRSFTLKAGSSDRELQYELGAQIFGPAGGCPNVYDRVGGRRAGTAQDFINATKLQQHFDAIHILGPSAEPQDIPPQERHYLMMEAQLTLSDKPTSIYARGHRQVMDAFEILRLGRGLDADAFEADVWIKTVINTNSPRMLDVPMAEGIIDFATHRQLSIVTPFCLAGAMAPITLSGALTLQHAECLAGITLAQLVREGAPVSYGGFASNVDMKSGAPAFGTPEHIKLMLGTGQLARHIGLPFRAAAGSASNIADAQGATENTNALWASRMAGATLTIHAAGWLEGGLCFGYEKFITDMEALQTIAELSQPGETSADLATASLAQIEPGGHFFDAPDTMARYNRAFYQPLVADLSNHGTWEAAGSLTAEERATKIWQNILRDFEPPKDSGDVADRIRPFIEKRKAEGGAPIAE
ncbi:MAG: trimethylamine methyltransferase family protein [Pseudomonadota bacterium]